MLEKEIKKKKKKNYNTQAPQMHLIQSNGPYKVAQALSNKYVLKRV